MCRWLAYSGSPITLGTVLLEPEHSLFDQRLHEQMGAITTNALYPAIEGSTDSELMVYLALSLGLNEDPVAAVERMAGLVEETAERNRIENPLQMTVETTNGDALRVFRYSVEQQSRSLFYCTNARSRGDFYPDNNRIACISHETRLVVSEPLFGLPGAWSEVPESNCGIIQPCADDLRPFRPARCRNLKRQ